MKECEDGEHKEAVDLKNPLECYCFVCGKILRSFKKSNDERRKKTNI